MKKKKRILIVDDHALFRKGVASLLDPLPDMEVIGEAGDGQQALQKAIELHPDLVLMDIQMQGWDGIMTTRRIKEELPDVKIVMLTISGRDDDLFEAIKAGAQGYLLKGIDPDELIKLLRGIHHGEAPISHLSAAKILEEFSRMAERETAEPNTKETLTAREIEVLELVAAGATNKEIAVKLVIAENTVKNHLSNILTKLHLRSRAHAAAYAVRENIIDEATLDD